MRVLVTGNNGYIGTVLCKRLLEEKMEVVGLDTNFYAGCNFFDLDYVMKQLVMDVRKIKKSDLAGFDAVIHLAALSNDPIGALNPELTSQINYLASVNLAKFAKQAGVPRFIFSSSCSVYGVAGDEMIDENGTLSPETAYARSKVETESAVVKLADDSFSPVFLRNSTVYGVSPMLRVDLVVNNLVGWAFTAGKLKVMSDGTPWRPLIHIQDISSAFIAVLKAPKDLIHNQVFNVGKNSENYRIKDIIAAIKKGMPQCNIEYTGEHGVDTRTYRVDFGKINRTLSAYFNPEWNIDKGIKELFDSYRKIGFTEKDFIGDKFTRLKRLKMLLNDNRVDDLLFWRKGDKG